MTSYAWISSTDGKRSFPYYDPATGTVKQQIWAGAGGWSTAIGGTFFNDILMIHTAYLAALWVDKFVPVERIVSGGVIVGGGQQLELSEPGIAIRIRVTTDPAYVPKQGTDPGTKKYGYVAFGDIDPTTHVVHFGPLRFINFKNSIIQNEDRTPFSVAYVYLNPHMAAEWDFLAMNRGPLTKFTSASTLQDVNPLAGPFPVSFS